VVDDCVLAHRLDLALLGLDDGIGKFADLSMLALPPSQLGHGDRAVEVIALALKRLRSPRA
jgi:hypothetical protein